MVWGQRGVDVEALAYMWHRPNPGSCWWDVLGCAGVAIEDGLRRERGATARIFLMTHYRPSFCVLPLS